MSDRDFWVGAARRLALRRNIAAWMDAFLPAVLGFSIAAAVGLLALRLMGLAGWELRFLWYGWGGALALAAVVCAALAGRHPFTLTDSLARLDEVARLHNRLTAAHSGVGPWPASKPGIRDTVRWNWPRLTVPVLIGGLLLGAAALLDLPRVTLGAKPNEEPIAWTHLESWLKTLDQAKIVDQPALDKLKEQVEEFRDEPEQEWYSQSSLEAGDALEQQTGQSLKAMEENLAKSSDLVAQAQLANQMSASQLQTLSASLENVAQGMISGNLPLNRELAGQLRSFDPSSLKSMTQSQYQALQQRLAMGQRVCSQCVGPHPGLSGTNCEMPSGHPGGGGPAQLTLHDQPEDLRTKQTQGASNDDMSRALPGEVIAIAKGRHNVDTNTPAGPVEAGAISSAGQGGDAVWRDSLTPDERQVLQKYFK
jgi:hypothetical protein